MNKAEQHFGSVGCPDNRQSAGFIFACSVAFVVSVAATVYFCRSMCCEMEMAGGWAMSMMWMRMPGQTWASSAASFLLMWLAMMVAMMLPSALPMLLNFRRSVSEMRNNHSDTPVILVAAGYFFVWLLIGVAVYVLGVAFALIVMHLEWFSRLVPALSGATLLAAGALQFTGWKISALRRCRAPGCCEALQTTNALRASWHHGLEQGMSCFICCAAPMLALLVLGSMNLTIMIVVTAVIAMEKLMPSPEPIVRFSGVAIAATGVDVIAKSLF